MKQLHSKQFLKIDIETAWNFFSSPNNLNKITPKEMVFEIKSTIPEKMYEGMFIMYTIKPFLNIPMNWVTEITHIKEKKYFVDEQRTGPYKIWHHEHHFEEAENGVLMTDILHYDIGKSIFGKIAGIVFVEKQVEKIFSYRYNILEDLFNKK